MGRFDFEGEFRKKSAMKLHRINGISRRVLLLRVSRKYQSVPGIFICAELFVMEDISSSVAPASGRSLLCDLQGVSPSVTSSADV